MTEIVAAKLKIRLNCKTKCNHFSTVFRNDPDLIMCAQRKEKHSHIKNPVPVDYNIQHVLIGNVVLFSRL